MNDILHIYTRVSSSIQEEGTSLKTQREIGIELSRKLNMQFQIHNEGGMSSSKDTLDNRPVLLNILNLMDKGVIKNLYVWNTDRLSRNQITWYTIRQRMVKNKVVLYTSNGVHDTQDFMENMILGILSEVAQYDNKVRTERSRLGKIEKVKLNYWRGGDCPFGFMLESDGKGNRLVENIVESHWIRYIYTEYSKGIPLKAIKAVLEEHKVRTRRDNELWSMGSLQVILKNEIYLGFVQFIDKKTNLTIKNNIPQLISNKMWDEVQERRKVRLQRKSQLNRTKNFYLFRDFLICSCGTPMGGRIKLGKSIRHYYCPIPERRFNNSYKNSVQCNMKRCLNIPATDKVLWEKIVDILSDTIKLNDTLRQKTVIGNSYRDRDVEMMIKSKDDKISTLRKTKHDLEKGLVSIETENILKKYPSNEIYEALKKDITIRYHQTLTEIEDVRNSLKQIGNDEKWFEWIRIFGQQIQRDKDISEQSKKELLKLILDNIVVAYDHNEKVHRLTINFKIPVCINDVRESSDRKTHVVVKAPKSGRKSSDQNEPVSNYSTVTDFARFLG